MQVSRSQSPQQLDTSARQKWEPSQLLSVKILHGMLAREHGYDAYLISGCSLISQTFFQRTKTKKKVEQGRGSRILSELLKRVSLVRAAIIGEVSVFIL